MSKVLLKPENDYDFDLIGISCHQKDYRLSFEINKGLELDLQKDNDLIINTKNGQTAFSLSLYIDEENHREYYLIANSGTGGKLVPEQNLSDFFLMIRGVISDEDIERCIEDIKRIEIVLAAYEIEISTLKSKENLIF